MADDRKKPGVAFWATVALVVVLAGYPLSLGPADWIQTRRWFPDQAKPAVAGFYSPLSWLVFNGPEPIKNVILWYEGIWI